MNSVSREEGQSILVIGEEKELVEDVVSQLASGFDKIATAHDVDEALNRIKSKAPKVIIFASASIVDAERAYLEILRKTAEFQAIPHYTVVTCKGPEVETAYGLCVRNVFDDYVVIRPLYDRFRLPIAVQQAIRLRDAMEQLADVSVSLGRAGFKIDGFSASMEHQLANARRLSAEVEANVGQAQDRIVGCLADIGTEFYQGMADQVSSQNAEETRRKFQEVARHAIQPELANAFGNTTAALGNWTESFAKEINKGRGAIKAVVDQAAELRAPVLVIEDDSVYRHVVSATLEEAGFRVHGVGSVAEALQAFSKGKYCCMLVDYELPDGSGIDLISRLWSLEIYKTLPVLLMTGHPERRVVEEAHKMGIRHFIVKPSQRDRIIKTLQDALAA
jgi:DNA-binding NtrC family response regulator